MTCTHVEILQKRYVTWPSPRPGPLAPPGHRRLPDRRRRPILARSGLGRGAAGWSAVSARVLGGGALWGLVDEPRSVTVLVPKGRDIVDRDAWVFRRETEGIRDRRSPGTPSRTTIEDSVVDLCAEADQTQIIDLVTRAVQGRPEPSEGAPTATPVTRSTPPSSSSTARSTPTNACGMPVGTTPLCWGARSRSATAGRMSRSGPAGSPGRLRPSCGPEDGRTKRAAARAVRRPGTPISRTGEVS
jgi:hypothetical protein